MYDTGSVKKSLLKLESAVVQEPDPLTETLSKLDAEWDDEALHKKALVLAGASHRLAELGRFYREVRDRDPERRAAAEKHIAAMLAQAMVQMQQLKEPRTEARSRVEWIAMGVSASLIAAALWAMLR